MMRKLIGGFLLVSLTFFGCDNYTGDRTDLSFIEIPESTFREVAYVPIQPALNQFSFPTDVIAGFDELIYVVDNGTEEVIALDESGRELGRTSVPGARVVAQDRKLDLLVIGTKQTDISGQIYNLPCIYRLDISQDFGYGIQYAEIVNEIVHPFYFKTSFLERDAMVTLNDITVQFDNQYYVTRSGPSNSVTQFGGPDDAVLLFGADDELVSPLSVTSNDGRFFLDYFKFPYGITSVSKPPQISASRERDFIYTSTDPNGVINVQYIDHNESDLGSAYTPAPVVLDTAQASGFISTPFKFSEPVGVEFTGDGTNYIFVTDRAKDSLFQFTNTGLEGVRPPPASGETKFVKTSFGGTGIELTQFRQPMAVAYKNRTLYVADAGNGRILRFKLTLDIQ